MNQKVPRRWHRVQGTYQLAPSTIIMQYGRMLRSFTHRVRLISGVGGTCAMFEGTWRYVSDDTPAAISCSSKLYFK